ncbi:YhgE/Pip family protein [Salinifilum ghardaiensis]
MKAFTLARLELLRFRGPLRRLVPVVLVLVPLLYGALYLWSNWDPYGRLDRIPVAVVNDDRPVEYRGQVIDAGNQFVEQLKISDTFDWHFVDGDRAQRGLRDGTYYFTISVPRDFSAKLATAGEPDPQRAQLHITKNDANGYIAGIMADTVRSELQNQVNAAAHTSYARALYGELDRIRDRLNTASEATRGLVDGTNLAEQGTSNLSEGLGDIVDGTGRLSDGVSTLARASRQLDQQMTELTDAAAGELPRAVDAMARTTDTAASGMSAVKQATGTVRPRAQQSADALERLGQRHPELREDSAYTAALDRAREAAAAAARADERAAQGLRAARGANERAVAMQNGMDQLQAKVRSVRAPVDTMTTGTSQLAGGMPGIVSGLQTLQSQGRTLHTGAQQMSESAQRLHELVTDSLDRIPPTDPSQVARAADVLGSPTTIEERNLNPAHVYGRGLAPFFFGIALWVFGLFAYLVLQPFNARALAGRASVLSLALGGFLPAGALGVLGGMVLYTAVDFGLGLNPVHAGWTIGLVSLAALAFVAIDHFLRTAFGAVGKLLSLVLLILQLTASGGLYPMETTPAPFQAIHPYLPMTYLVDGLRVTISGGLTEHLVRDLVVLGCVLVVFLGLTTLTVLRRRMWTPGRLHPQIEV